MPAQDVLKPAAHQFPADRSVPLLDELQHARRTGCERRIAAAERELILEFLPLATRVAQRHRGRGVELEDLIQVARVGLVKAVRGWRPQPGGGFLQYAGPMMLGEIQRHIRDRAAPIRLSRRVHELRPSILNARVALERTGQAFTETTLALMAGVTLEDVREDSQSYERSHPQSIHAFQDIDDRLGLQCGRSEQDRRILETRDALRAAISNLTDRERRVLGLRFYKDMSQQEIAADIGLSQMQISRVLAGAFAKLRCALEKDVADTN